jgi:hypothetical protein
MTWLRLAVWTGVVGALAWYAAAVANPLWVSLSILAAMAIGVALGISITPRWFALAVLPMIVFAVGGVVISTQFSNTHGDGGDWSAAAVVVVCGIVDGLAATVALLATFVARRPLRVLMRRAQSGV